MKMLVIMQQSPARACLDCEVRRALRLSQHTTRKPKVGRAARDQSGLLGLGYNEKGGGGVWKCASTRKSTQDVEEPELGSQHQQLGEAPQAKASCCPNLLTAFQSFRPSTKYKSVLSA